MKSPPRAAFGVVVLLVVVSGVVPAATADEPSLFQELPESDNTVTRIAVHSDGTATWTLEVRTRLENPEQVEQYRGFQVDFRENTSRYLDLFRERITGVVARAANVTGRGMRATDFRAETRIQELPRRWGIVSFEFTWHGFAASRDGNLVVGDVFESGFFIAEEDTLEIHAPEGHTVATVEPTPAAREGGVLVWTGERYFADERPRVAFAPPTATPTQSGQSNGTSSLLVGLALVLSVAVGAGAFALSRRRGGSEPAIDGDPRPDDAGTDAASGSDDLVTDEERVVALLEENGGRMRQADVVSELGWSKAKTSRTLSSMADDGTITKLRLGRENVVELEDGE